MNQILPRSTIRALCSLPLCALSTLGALRSRLSIDSVRALRPTRSFLSALTVLTILTFLSVLTILSVFSVLTLGPVLFLFVSQVGMRVYQHSRSSALLDDYPSGAQATVRIQSAFDAHEGVGPQ
jgi:hypothetical protein